MITLFEEYTNKPKEGDWVIISKPEKWAPFAIEYARYSVFQIVGTFKDDSDFYTIDVDGALSIVEKPKDISIYEVITIDEILYFGPKYTMMQKLKIIRQTDKYNL